MWQVACAAIWYTDSRQRGPVSILAEGMYVYRLLGFQTTTPKVTSLPLFLARAGISANMGVKV